MDCETALINETQGISVIVPLFFQGSKQTNVFKFKMLCLDCLFIQLFVTEEEAGIII